MSGKRILLVDYDPRSLTHTREVLEGAGFNVSTCGDGLSALDQFKSAIPDLVLLSAMLPKMHGFEVCSNIRKLPGGDKTPVVIITDVYKGKRYRIDAINKYGATEYIEKPIEDTNLLTILTGLVKENGKDVQAAPPDLDSERTVQFNRDLLAQMVREVPISGVKTVSEKPKPKDDMARKLEQSLAGLDLDQTRKPKPKPKPADVPSGPVNVAVSPPPPAPTQILPQQPPPAASVEPPGGPVFTSEDLFTDIIASVERELQSEKVAAPKASPEPPAAPPAPPPTEIIAKPEIRPEVPRPPEPKPEPVPPVAPARPSAAELAKKAGFDSGLEKKLSTTLSGLKAAAAKQPAPPASKPADVLKPPAAAKAPEAPKKPEPRRVPEQPRLEEPAKPAAAETAPPPSAAKVEAPPPPPPLAVEKEAAQEGINFGQYLLLSKIATGGMAELFKAKRKGVEGFEKILAIKRILPHMSDNEEFVTMFIDEAKLAAQLTHHNICQIFDLGSVGNAYYIAMEYVHGKDLRAVLKACRAKSRTIPVDLAILITSKIASALDYAHRKRGSNGHPLNLVHRDVSPQNILISYEGEVKLVDFGIAKAATKVHVTQHGALKGKLLYMSPEQAWGRTVDKRSDLFSLGIVFYEMLTGRPLFFDENDTEVTILEKVREAKVPPVREFNSRVSQDLDRIISKALKKSPDERYQVAFDLQKDLDNLFYTEGYNATSGSLAELVRNLFLEEWTLEGEGKEVEKPAIAAAPVAATPVVAASAAPAPPSAVPAPPAPVKEAKKDARQKGAPKPQKAAAAEKPEPVSQKPKEPELPPIPVPKPDAVIRPQEAPVPTFREISSPSIMVPSESRGFPKIAAIIAVVVIVGIVAFLLFRPKSGDKPAPVSPQPQAQQPVNPAPVSQEPTTAAEDKTQVPTPVEAAKTDDQKKKEEEQKRLDAQKAEEEKKKEDARKKEELARLQEEQKAQALKEAQATTQEPPKMAEVQPPPVETPVQEPPKQEPVAAETPKETPKPAPVEPSTKEGDLVELTPDVSKPELVSRVNPAYPPAAQKNRIEGTVILSLLISEGGQVADVKLLRPAGKSSGLNEAAMAAVRQWKFRPAVKDGKRVKVWVTYPIVFKLN